MANGELLRDKPEGIAAKRRKRHKEFTWGLQAHPSGPSESLNLLTPSASVERGPAPGEQNLYSYGNLKAESSVRSGI
jgi:hypothetical protein